MYKFYWPVLWQYRAIILDGLLVTLVLFFSGGIAAIVLGTIFGAISAIPSRLARVACEFYVEINRNTPLIVKLFFLYFAFGLEAYPAAIFGLALHQSAYLAEVVRSGIQSISKGQMEAGLSTGLSRAQVMRRIIFPQAFIIVLPPATTQIIETLKNTSVAMTIAIPELTFQTQHIEAYSFRGFEAATAATVIYLLMSFGISAAALAAEWKLRSRRLRAYSVGIDRLAPT